MSYVLDTDVISQLTKQRPDEASFAWMQRTRLHQMYLSAITVLELRFGIEQLPQGARRVALEAWLSHEVLKQYQSRLLPAGTAIADDAGRLLAKSTVRAAQVQQQDALIAATARVYGYAVATLNRKHFKLLDVRLVDF